jgi:hypothetical protein
MKANTGLLALGLFTLAGVITVSCGGDSGSNTDNTAGTSPNAGTTSRAGTTGDAAGTSSSTAGKSAGGSANNNGGTVNDNGGRNSNNGGAPDFPGLGGAGNIPSCPDGTKAGGVCAAGDACQLNDTTYCGCNAQKWACIDTGAFGGGGDGPLGGAVTCPDNAKNGDACTGLGLCPGSQTCGCALGTVYCQQ